MKMAESEVVMTSLDVKSCESLRFLGREALIERLVHEEHEVIADRVHRGHNAQKLAVGLEACADGSQGPIDQANVGHDERINGHGNIKLAGELSKVVHRAVEKGDAGRGLGPYP